MDKYTRYESLKARWVRENPKASSQQYEAAMRAIAKQCGV